MNILIAMILSTHWALAADKQCPDVDWAKIKETWTHYGKAPSDKIEKILLKLLPVDDAQAEGCPAFDEASKAIAQDLVPLQKRVAMGTKSPLCLAFRLQAFSAGALAMELEKITNEGLRHQKGLDELAFQNACMTMRKSVNAANYEEKFAKGKMVPSEKSCEEELERFVEYKKKWMKSATEAKNKKKCLLVLKKVSASSPKNALFAGISELVATEQTKIGAKCEGMEE